jgi:U1 small nuclear ribonucleoprotein C
LLALNGLTKINMPRFFDDYSNTYLTHDSAAGRKQQRRGWKFRENFKLHYDKYLPGWRSGPMGLASAQQAFLRQTGLRPPRPDGWKEEFDEVTKASFSIHEESGERTWVRPGFLPPGFVGSGPMPPVVANSACEYFICIILFGSIVVHPCIDQ